MTDTEQYMRCSRMIRDAIDEAGLVEGFSAEIVLAALISVAATAAAKGGILAGDFARALEGPAADIRAGNITFPPYGSLS